MDKFIKDACEEIDATIFSSDCLHSTEAREEFRGYLQRWNRWLKSFEEEKQDGV